MLLIHFFCYLANEGDSSHLFCSCFFGKYDKIISQDELTFAQKEVFCKDRGSNAYETLGKIEADF